MNEHDLAEFYFSQAQTHFRLGDIERSIRLVTQSIQLSPAQNYYIFRATSHTTAAHIAESLEDANQAIQTNPSNPEALFCRAEAYFYAGEFELALVDYYQVVSMRFNDSRDQKGVSKCVDCIKNATSCTAAKVEHFIKLLAEGSVVETSLFDASSHLEFQVYVPGNETPKETSVSELVTQYIETEDKPKLEKRLIVHNNYCHVTYDKIFLYNKSFRGSVVEDVRNAISYIENRETFWKNQNKTTRFRETKRINKAAKTVVDKNSIQPSETILRQSEKRRQEVARNLKRKIVIPAQPGVLRGYVDSDYAVQQAALNLYGCQKYDEALRQLANLQRYSLATRLLSAKINFKLGCFDEVLEESSSLIEECQKQPSYKQNTQRILVDAFALNALAWKKKNNLDASIQILRSCMRFAEYFGDAKATEFCVKQSREISRLIKKYPAATAQ